jgi:hypothetical protein
VTAPGELDAHGEAIAAAVVVRHVLHHLVVQTREGSVACVETQ